MMRLPATKNALVLRTDFSNDQAWHSICSEIQDPASVFQANVDCVSDPAFNRLDPDQILNLNSNSQYRSFLFIVDRITVSQLEHPVLVMDLSAEPGRTFRVIPSEMWGIENNLSIGNMDFAEFADNTDSDGVFRGFPRS